MKLKKDLLKNYTIIDGTIINAGEPIFEIAPAINFNNIWIARSGS